MCVTTTGPCSEMVNDFRNAPGRCDGVDGANPSWLKAPCSRVTDCTGELVAVAAATLTRQPKEWPARCTRGAVCPGCTGGAASAWTSWATACAPTRAARSFIV